MNARKPIDCFCRMILFCLFLFGGITAYSQQLIKGNIKDEQGLPLEGVSITVKGSSAGTTSDASGNFSFPELRIGAIVLFSHTGFEDKEFSIVSPEFINVVMSLKGSSLENVVVIGYGSVNKKEVASAITHLDPSDFNKGNVNNPAQLFQGKVAGLSVVAPQGNPNGSFNIRLRGLSTVGANSQPLVIVDGVIGVELNSVDPNDIATIDVLKDGGAAAIYGTRGSSGVILITTKSGIHGKAQVEYHAYLASETKDRALPAMDRQTYLSNGGTDYGSNTNWIDEITRAAISNVHNLSLSGGTEKTKYMASFNIRDVQGVLVNSGFQQLGARLNLSQKALRNKLTLTFNFALNNRSAKLGYEDAFRAAVAMPPTAPIYSSDSYYEKYRGYFQSEVHELYNPLSIVDLNINDQVIKRATYNIKADYEIVKGLSASIRYARNSENTTSGKYISKYSYYGSGVDRNGLASRGSFDSQNNLFEATGNYTKRINDFNVSILGGYSYQDFKSENFNIEAGNFLTDAFGYNNFAAAKDFADGKALSNSFKESNRLVAFFSRVNLNFRNIYFLSASLRREGSSRFGSGNKWGNFPGISAGADIARLIDIPYVDQLKVRASYGVTGALPGASYLSQQLYGPGSSPTYFLYNGVYTPVYSPQSNANPDLKWETKAETDFGIDFSMFDSRLSGSFDFYNRITNDALITLDVPVPPNLYSTKLLNAGKLQNKGIELMLEYQVVRNNNFNWVTRGTFSTYNTKVVNLSMGDIRYGVREVGGLPAPLTGNTVRVEEGKPLGQMIGWVYKGIDASGNYIIEDVDKNGVINEQDITIIGRGLPKGDWGWSNTFRYKNFDLNFFIRGVYGHDLVNLNRTMFEQVSRISSYNLIQTDHFDPAYKGPAAYNSNYIEKASFLKFDNIALGYNFQLPAQSVISAFRVYASAQNLFYLTKYTGVDPEPRYADSNGNVLAPGVEPRNSWLTTRTVTVGVNLKF